MILPNYIIEDYNPLPRAVSFIGNNVIPDNFPYRQILEENFPKYYYNTQDIYPSYDYRELLENPWENQQKYKFLSRFDDQKQGRLYYNSLKSNGYDIDKINNFLDYQNATITNVNGPKDLFPTSIIEGGEGYPYRAHVINYDKIDDLNSDIGELVRNKTGLKGTYIYLPGIENYKKSKKVKDIKKDAADTFIEEFGGHAIPYMTGHQELPKIAYQNIVYDQSKLYNSPFEEGRSHGNHNPKMPGYSKSLKGYLSDTLGTPWQQLDRYIKDLNSTKQYYDSLANTVEQLGKLEIKQKQKAITDTVLNVIGKGKYIEHTEGAKSALKTKKALEKKQQEINTKLKKATIGEVDRIPNRPKVAPYSWGSTEQPYLKLPSDKKKEPDKKKEGLKVKKSQTSFEWKKPKPFYIWPTQVQ